MALVRLPRSCAGVVLVLKLVNTIGTTHPTPVLSFLSRDVAEERKDRSGVFGGKASVAKNVHHPGARPGSQ